MRYANFEVSADVILDFTREMHDREITAVIVGVNDDDELTLRVGYERDESDKVDELEDKLEELVDAVYEDENEEEEEEEQEDDENKTSRRRR